MDCVADNIKRIMGEKHFSKGSIAAKAGYSFKAFNNMINGQRDMTDLDITRIAMALEVEPNDLFGLKNERG